jgi:hypothetical protein
MIVLMWSVITKDEQRVTEQFTYILVRLQYLKSRSVVQYIQGVVNKFQNFFGNSASREELLDCGPQFPLSMAQKTVRNPLRYGQMTTCTCALSFSGEDGRF